MDVLTKALSSYLNVATSELKQASKFSNLPELEDYSHIDAGHATCLVLYAFLKASGFDSSAAYLVIGQIAKQVMHFCNYESSSVTAEDPVIMIVDNRYLTMSSWKDAYDFKDMKRVASDTASIKLPIIATSFSTRSVLERVVRPLSSEA